MDEQQIKRLNLNRIIIMSSMVSTNLLYILLGYILYQYAFEGNSILEQPFMILLLICLAVFIFMVTYLIKNSKIDYEIDYGERVKKNIIQLALIHIPAFLGMLYFVLQIIKI